MQSNSQHQIILSWVDANQKNAIHEGYIEKLKVYFTDIVYCESPAKFKEVRLK